MNQYAYIFLLFALFVVPRALQRYRIPTAITSFAIGAASGHFGLLRDDPTVGLLATLGIVALFLFAGLDVEVKELRSNAAVLLQHLAIQLASLGVLAFSAAQALGLDSRAATLVALALLTPSTGFILDSLAGYGLPEHTRFWIKSKAIATELVALGVLFATLQSTSVSRLAWSSIAMAVIVGVLPLVFRLFASFLVPYAPKSEFGFLMMVAVACALATHELGVYYLVGAFVVGMAAQQMRTRMPAIASERMLAAVEAFASLFVPFYFFNAGLQLETQNFTLPALLCGAAFFAIGVSVRALLVWVHRRVVFRESFRESLLVSTPMMPTLVFTLVIAEILRKGFGAPPALVGGLILYTILTSILPGFLLRAPLPEIEDELLEEETLPPRVPSTASPSSSRGACGSGSTSAPAESPSS